MDFSQVSLGEALALITAVVWAFAVICFKKSGEQVHPIGLNLFKNLLAFILFIPTVYIFGEELFRDVPAWDYFIIGFSGVLGIGIADTLFFKSLNLLGAGRAAIVDCLYSPFIIGLSILWLGETLNFWQVFGVILIISAVLTATGEKQPSKLERRSVILGVLWGALAMAAMAVGVVMVKPLLDQSPLMWVTEVRLLGGILCLLVVLAFHPSRRVILKSVYSTKRWNYTLAGSFLGAYVSMVLWLGGMKYTQASIAAALNQTNTIIIFILAAVFLKEKITIPRLIGIILAFTGVIMITYS